MVFARHGVVELFFGGVDPVAAAGGEGLGGLRVGGVGGIGGGGGGGAGDGAGDAGFA